MQQLMRIQIKSQTTCLVLIMEIEYKETKVRVEHCVCEHYHLVEILHVWVFVSVKEGFFLISHHVFVFKLTLRWHLLMCVCVCLSSTA